MRGKTNNEKNKRYHRHLFSVWRFIIYRRYDVSVSICVVYKGSGVFTMKKLKAYWIIFSHWFMKKYPKLHNVQMELDFIHQQFGLTYASWLVLPRVLMAEMPTDWQKEMVRLWDEFYDTWDMDLIWRNGSPEVMIRDKNGKLRSIEQTGLPHYRHPGSLELFKKA